MAQKKAQGALDPEDPLYEAFRREDSYGDLGWKKQPLAERVRLAVVACTLVPLKFLGCFYFVVAFYLVCRLAFLIPASERRAWVERTGCICARCVCLCIGLAQIRWVEVRPNGRSDQIFSGIGCGSEPPVGAVVSNHVSYIDILVLLARYFPSFVARSNTQDLPFIGVCSKYLECIFVDRDFKKGGGEVKGAAAQVKERMQRVAGGEALRPVLLFPEGTTTNGRTLLPFKTGAFLAGVPIQPVFIKYRGGGRVSVAWDSIDALWHVFLVLAQPLHSVTVYLLPIYKPSEAEKADPGLYATNVRQLLMDAGGFGSSEASLLDCRAYISLLQGKRPHPRSRAGQLLEAQGGGSCSSGGAAKKRR